jgi:hypothetical protein
MNDALILLVVFVFGGALGFVVGMGIAKKIAIKIINEYFSRFK